jgi:hypothetical protein
MPQETGGSIMPSKSLKCAAVLAMLLGPASAHAAEGDPGTGQAKGTEAPASQPITPKQGTATTPTEGSAKMGAAGNSVGPGDTAVKAEGSAKMEGQSK